MEQVEILKRKLERSIQARKDAETILEKKALELFEANNKLLALNQNLEKQIEERTKALSDSEFRYRNIVQNASDFIFNVNHKGEITFINEAGLEALGMAKETYKKMPFVDLIHADDKEKVRSFYKHVVKEKIKESSIEFKVVDNIRNIEWLEQSVTISFDESNKILFTGVARDISEKKRYEHELKNAKNIAEKAQQAEKTFLANMSHEMRTPLNAIIGMSHLLKDDISEAQRENLDILMSSANVLQSLIADVLDLAKIDSGELELHENEFNLKELVHDLNKTFQLRINPNAVKLHLEFDEQIDHYLIGDRLLLNQVLLNFVGNAVKFTKEGEIYLRIRKISTSKETMKVLIQVEDTGIGIKEKDIGGIFDRFKQANSKIKSTFGGTGLGLAITKQIVDLMGGHLEVESKFGKGSKFSCILDLGKSKRKIDTTVVNSDKVRDYSSIPHNVLVVEDNLVNQKYIGKLLDKWKVNFHFADDGLDAVSRILEQNYSLIFMDIQMPNMDGYQATRVIRGYEKYSETPIIALSASTLVSSKEEAKESGMTDFLSKPFNPSQLGDVMDKYIIKLAMSEQFKSPVETIFSDSDLTLDPRYITEFFDDDPEDAIEMLDIFLNNSAASFSDLSNCFQNDDMKALKNIVHKLKPTFQMIGLRKLTADFQQLEQEVIGGNKKEVSLMLEKFEEQREQIVQLVYEELKRLKSL